MAKQAAAKGMEAMSLGGASSLNAFAPAFSMAAQRAQIGTDIPPTDPRHWAQRQLAEFMGQTAEQLHRRRLRTHVENLDPDLAVNRSLSLSIKVRIQRDRNFERNQFAQKQSLLNDINDAIKSWSRREERDDA
jgi:deoxyadenosine/deoxycytidine kinase